jgi:anti-sigma regulatory factor (Ser/Thr protein kinase)
VPRRADGFSHEALFYAGPSEFVDSVGAFIRGGVEAGEPVLVMVTADKIELLREELGADADGVTFADMAEAGRNPGRIISAWSDFAAGFLAEGRRMRGVGEPIWAGRSADELVECQHHESLLNVAFDHADGFRLICPYDTAALPADVIEEAERSHPVLVMDGQLRASTGYRDAEAIGQRRDPLPPPSVASLEMGFQESNLDSMRRFVESFASDAGLAGVRAGDLVVAVSEAAANSVRHGGGEGLVRAWREPGAVVCEVRDRGRIAEPLVGRFRPESGIHGGFGLWLAHQLCDLVQIRSRRGGTVVRLHMRLASA